MIDIAHLKHQITLAVAALGLALVASLPFVITGLAG
jgi:hypothetical protein